MRPSLIPPDRDDFENPAANWETDRFHGDGKSLEILPIDGKFLMIYLIIRSKTYLKKAISNFINGERQ